MRPPLASTASRQNARPSPLPRAVCFPGANRENSRGLRAASTPGPQSGSSPADRSALTFARTLVEERAPGLPTVSLAGLALEDQLLSLSQLAPDSVVITSTGEALRIVDALGPGAPVGSVDAAPPGAAPDAGAKTLSDLERDHIVATLEKTYWRLEGETGAAARLGINPSTLRSRMRKHGIRRPASRPTGAAPDAS
jgi:hypothetical protein